MSTLLLQLHQFFFTFYYSFCTVSNPLFTNYKRLVYLLYSRGQQCSYIQFIKLILYSVIKVVVKVTFSLLSFSCWVKSLIFLFFFNHPRPWPDDRSRRGLTSSQATTVGPSHWAKGNPFLLASSSSSCLRGRGQMGRA